MTTPEVSSELRAPDEIFESILEAHGARYPAVDENPIRQAYKLAVQHHAGQHRQTGEPFILHPLIVTEMLTKYGLDAATLIAAILHDTVEDTDLTLDEIEAEFDAEVSELIDGVTKLDRIKFSSPEEHQAATIRKMVIAMAKDIRVLLIKLADRLHNVRTLDPFPLEKQQRIARETLEVYAPLAHRLGVQEIKHEMEERCFSVLHPKRKAELEDLMRRRAPEREEALEIVMKQMCSSLEETGIKGEVTGRPKHLFSIYRKMVDSGLAFDQIYDLIGIRIIVPEVRDCYATLGIAHTLWPPIQGRFKDYIAMPKFNLYQSLHTTVLGPDGKALEVQIRTKDMHAMAEVGVAAHWTYKEGVNPGDISLVSDIRFLQEEYANPTDFLANLKLDLYQDEVFALTPKGDVLSLPKGATPVDFAYRIHTDVGHSCVGARVNGRLKPLSTLLESGDIVEVLTSRAQDAHPSRDWLEFVKSSRAAAKIRQWFTKQRREAAFGEGKDLVVKMARREGVALSGRATDKVLTDVALDLGFKDLDSLYVSIGDGRTSAQTVVSRVGRLLDPEGSEQEDLLAPPIERKARPRPAMGIVVEGLDDMLVRIARCCAPVPGDDIIGFVTIGRGVSVHRSDCANIGSLHERAERLIEVSWAVEQSSSFFVWIQVEALDRPRLLRDVTAVLSDLGANIQASSSGTGRDRIAILRYEVELSDRRILERAIAQLQAVDGVFDAYRLVPQDT